MIPPPRSRPLSRSKQRRDSLSTSSTATSSTVQSGTEMVVGSEKPRALSPSNRLHRRPSLQESNSPALFRQRTIQCQSSSSSESHIMNHSSHRVGGNFVTNISPNSIISPNLRNMTRTNILGPMDRDEKRGRCPAKLSRSSSRGPTNHRTINRHFPTVEASKDEKRNERNPNESKAKTKTYFQQQQYFQRTKRTNSNKCRSDGDGKRNVKEEEILTIIPQLANNLESQPWGGQVPGKGLKYLDDAFDSSSATLKCSNCEIDRSIAFDVVNMSLDIDQRKTVENNVRSKNATLNLSTQQAKDAADIIGTDSKPEVVLRISRRASTGDLLDYPRPRPFMSKYLPLKNCEPRDSPTRKSKVDKKIDSCVENERSESPLFSTASTTSRKCSGSVRPNSDKESRDESDIKVPSQRTSKSQANKMGQNHHNYNYSKTFSCQDDHDPVANARVPCKGVSDVIVARKIDPFAPVPVRRSLPTRPTSPLTSQGLSFVENSYSYNQPRSSNMAREPSISTTSTGTAISSSLLSSPPEESAGGTLIRRNSLLGSLLGNDDDMSISSLVSSEIEGFVCAGESAETGISKTATGTRRLSVTFQCPLEEIMHTPMKEDMTEEVGFVVSNTKKTKFLPIATQEIPSPAFSRNQSRAPPMHPVERTKFYRSSSMDCDDVRRSAPSTIRHEVNDFHREKVMFCQSVGKDDFECVCPPPPPTRRRSHVRYDKQNVSTGGRFARSGTSFSINELIAPNESKHEKSVEMKKIVIPSKDRSGARPAPPRRQSIGCSEMNAKQRLTKGNAPPPPPLRRRRSMF
ncbi:hypothetical protein ACHAXS_005763 [Conticribra weissflogii]